MLVSGPGSSVDNSDTIGIQNGIFSVTNGGTVESTHTFTSGQAEIHLDGVGTSWTNDGYFDCGGSDDCTMSITGGARLEHGSSLVGYHPGSEGHITIDGPGSSWTTRPLTLGKSGTALVDITNGGLMKVSTSSFRFDTEGTGTSSIDMASGGMLAIRGNADDSITDFLSLIDGTDPIRYWDGSDWSLITNGIEGIDYTLDYFSSGDLAQHTLLTVAATGPPPTVPEPSSWILGLLGLAGIGLACWRRRPKARLG